MLGMHAKARGQQGCSPVVAPSASLRALGRCLAGASGRARIINGQQYIPLSEAQRFFEAGLHANSVAAGAIERLSLNERRADELELELCRLQSRVQELADMVQEEREGHERELRQLFEYAMALEAEVERGEHDMQQALEQAAHEAEGRLARQYERLLAEAHEAEEHAIQACMNGQMQHMGSALRAAHEAKGRWRDRALQAERQFGQLLAMVEARLQQASQDALLRQQLRQNQQHQNQNQDHQQGRSAADAPQAGGEA